MPDQPPAPEGKDAPYIPLPSGLTAPRATAGGIFDRIASLYDRARPGYPPDALSDLLRICHVQRSSRILEIGCGTGQLTRDLAPTGAKIRCIEPGDSLAQIARTNLAHDANVEVVTTTFEALEVRPGSYDVVMSATAFHWIDPHLSYAKASTLLRPGGFLGLITNVHASGGTHTNPRVAEPIRALHRRLAREIGDWSFPTAEEIQQKTAVGGDIGQVWAAVERKLSDPPDVSGLFDPPTVKTYPWLATYDTAAYLDLLASQSSYALMDDARRHALLGAIGELIDRHFGGVITKQYVTILAAARRRDSTPT